MPLPCAMSQVMNATSAPRIRNSRARRFLAISTCSFFSASASKAMITRRPSQVTRSRSGITPLTSLRSPFGPVVLPIVPRQFQTPANPSGKNRGAVDSWLTRRQSASVLNSPSVTITGVATAFTKSWEIPGTK